MPPKYVEEEPCMAPFGEMHLYCKILFVTRKGSEILHTETNSCLYVSLLVEFPNKFWFWDWVEALLERVFANTVLLLYTMALLERVLDINSSATSGFGYEIG